MEQAGLFGIENCNRDLSSEKSWGKNQFNNNFPVALINYMESIDLEPVYLKINNDKEVIHSYISVTDLFNKHNVSSSSLYFSFETGFSPYQRFAIGEVPRADLCIMELGKDNNQDKNLTALEIKLTALPDNSTYDLSEDAYSCEIVIRPTTIVYLAFSIAEMWIDNEERLIEIFQNSQVNISDWQDGNEVLKEMPQIISVLDQIILENISAQSPLIIQPVWKTLGKSPKLADDCLDVFIWSNLAFTRLFIDSCSTETNTINRLHRSAVWLYHMLEQYAFNKNINYKNIIDTYTYNTKNDKAFSLVGKRTYKYLKCDELKNPRVGIEKIQNIILGGGEKFLSPERRFDAAIVSAPGLFE